MDGRIERGIPRCGANRLHVRNGFKPITKESLRIFSPPFFKRHGFASENSRAA
jgi:hypothetical protein